MFKKILGYLLIALAVLVVIGNIFTLPSLFKTDGYTEGAANGYIIGKVTATVIMLTAAYFLFRLGRKMTKVKKTGVEV